MWRYMCVLLVTSATLLNYGCKTDQETEASDLIGQWEVVSAERNGRPTETLDGAYFNIFDDGRMMTNIPGLEEGNYTVDGTEIRFEGSANAVFYVGYVDQTAMQLSFELLGNQFNLALERKTEE